MSNLIELSTSLRPKPLPTLNPVLRPFWEAPGYRNRVLYGGRMSSKSWDAAGFALFLASEFTVRFLCTRHFQNKLADSVYTLLQLRSQEFGMEEEFKFTDSGIVHRVTKSEFLFYGRARNIGEIKSIENIDIHWGEECALLTKEQWDIIEPTIRKEGSQNWLIFNPDLKSDFVYRRFVLNPPPNTLVRRINHDENQFLSETARGVIAAAKAEDYDEYMHIYEGVPREDNDASLIKSSWIEAAVDAHIKLGIIISGAKGASLDVADEGNDLNALCVSHGILVQSVEEWSGKGGDIYATTEKTINRCDELGILEFDYDSDGLGVGCRGDARVINDERERNNKHRIEALPFRGSGAVIDPDDAVPGLRDDPERDKIERKNGDFFVNFKAQSWWSLRLRFYRTYRAVVHGEKFDEADLIALDSQMNGLDKLKLELEQPAYKRNGAGKVIVDKTPDDLKSPNKADSVMIRFSPRERPRNSIFG